MLEVEVSASEYPSPLKHQPRAGLARRSVVDVWGAPVKSSRAVADFEEGLAGSCVWLARAQAAVDLAHSRAYEQGFILLAMLITAPHRVQERR